MKKYEFKTYVADRTITAIKYDGTNKCKDYIIKYSRGSAKYIGTKLKIGFNEARNNYHFTVEIGEYVVIYPSGSWYPYASSPFESRFVTKTRKVRTMACKSPKEHILKDKYISLRDVI